jgi:hypothetical protein
VLQAITCDTLGDLDRGAARLIIDAAIREALSDLEDRGADDGKPRKVTVDVTFKLLDNGEVAATVEAHARAPKRRTASTIAAFKGGLTGEVRLMFRQGAPNDPTQRTIDEAGGHDGRQER